MYSEMEGKSRHVFTWTIENFRAFTQKNGHFIKSPAFVAESLDDTTWFVKLFSRGDVDTSKEYISIFLQRSLDCTGPDVIECDYAIKVINRNNEVLKYTQYTSKFTKGRSLGWTKFMERKLILDENTFSFHDTLTIEVTLKKRLPKIFTKNSCWTKVTTDEFSFKWNKMKPFSLSAENKTVSFSENLRFELKIETPEDDVEISIRRIDGFKNSEILLCRVTLLDTKGEEADSKETIFEADDPIEIDTWKFPTFLKKSKISAGKDVDENYFTLKFDFSHSFGKTSESMKDSECIFLDDFLKTKGGLYASLKTDLKRVFTENIHTDVELNVGKQVIPAHKVILSARSPVFLTMFKQDMVETQTGAINISDVELETLKSLLAFMYTGDTEILDYKSALELLLAADKYEVLSLKEKCSSSLEYLLSDENVCDILFTADLIQQESLKVCAVNYIKGAPKRIFKTDEWKELSEKNLKLATETFCEVSTFKAEHMEL